MVLRHRKLLTTLSSLALGAASVISSGTGAQAQAGGLIGLVTQLADACLQEVNGVMVAVDTQIAINRCCAVLSEVSNENMDFLTAIALADPTDPRLEIFDPELVAILLSCQQAALDRLAVLATETDTAAGGPPGGPDIYEG